MKDSKIIGTVNTTVYHKFTLISCYIPKRRIWEKFHFVFCLLLLIFLLTSCSTLLSYKHSFLKEIYSYDKLYDAVLLDLNMRGVRVLNTEKSVGLIHTETEEILLTRTNTDIIYSRTTQFSSNGWADAWQKYNDNIIQDISTKYFQINAQ
jgi:hypothetical protein